MTGDGAGYYNLESFDTPEMKSLLERKLERRTEWKNVGKGMSGLTQMDDRELLEKAFSAKNGDTVKRLQFGYVADELSCVLFGRKRGTDDENFRNERIVPSRQTAELLRIYGNQGGKGHAALYAAQSSDFRAQIFGQRKQQGIKGG